jgi:hypothetical protein
MLGKLTGHVGYIACRLGIYDQAYVLGVVGA